MGLSSNILWHQTSKKGFYTILETLQLRYAYSVETIFVDGGVIRAAFPMVSFCDLPFSELDFFLNCENSYVGKKFSNYGGYVFGFTREWGKRNGLSPVWYCDQHSDILTQIHDYWTNNKLNIFLYNLVGNIKNAEGQLEKFYADRYRFLDEREYRKLAPFSMLPEDKIILTPEQYDKYKADKGSSLLEPGIEGIHFCGSDIAYIIVPDIEDKHTVLRQYGHIFGRMPIFTRDEINENFIGIRHHHVIEPAPEEKSTPKTKIFADQPLMIGFSTNYENLSSPIKNKNLFGKTPVIDFTPWTMPQYIKNQLPYQPLTDTYYPLNDEIDQAPNFLDLTDPDTLSTNRILADYLQKIAQTQQSTRPKQEE